MVAAEHPVAVIGAGPVGLFTALLLAQKGIKVVLHESGKGVDQSPRAVAYFPAVLEEFAKAGVIADVVEAGAQASDGVDWKDADGKLLAGITPPPSDKSFIVSLAQPELGEILLEKLLATGNVKVIFNDSLSKLEQSDDIVRYWTISQSSGEEVEHQCQYLVGADGGRSTVRRSLGIRLEGNTFETFQFVAVNFQYPLTEHGWKQATYIVDPEDWGVVVRRGKGTSWRLATGVRKSSTDQATGLDEATINIVKKRLARILPGDTSRIQYENMAPYTVHQRCATRFREGRVLLAGDAAHLNNPVGGLGLTTGLLDAAHLSKALEQVLEKGVSTKVLTSYAETRRRIFLEITEPASLANIQRLYASEPADVKKRDEDFAIINNPKEFIKTIAIGLPDLALTSTSDKIFDTQSKVEMFISVSKIPEWTTEKFNHEYKAVHANMTRPVPDRPQVVERYIQLSNSETTVENAQRPTWDYVTCLTFPSLFITHVGFSDPGYKATAGSHVFCRLDQHGCLAKKVANFSKGSLADKSYVGAVQCLIFHKRKDELDDYFETWFTERAKKWKDSVDSDVRLHTYTLWRDVTPKNTEHFFKDTQFSSGSWNEFKAVEAFHFADKATSDAFLQEHKAGIWDTPADEKITVVGEPDIIV